MQYIFAAVASGGDWEIKKKKNTGRNGQLPKSQSEYKKTKIPWLMFWQVDSFEVDHLS
jgi:hypothetical protein